MLQMLKLDAICIYLGWEELERPKLPGSLRGDCPVTTGSQLPASYLSSARCCL
jgi:hypothetical protein